MPVFCFFVDSYQMILVGKNDCFNFHIFWIFISLGNVWTFNLLKIICSYEYREIEKHKESNKIHSEKLNLFKSVIMLIWAFSLQFRTYMSPIKKLVSMQLRDSKNLKVCPQFPSLLKFSIKDRNLFKPALECFGLSYFTLMNGTNLSILKPFFPLTKTLIPYFQHFSFLFLFI